MDSARDPDVALPVVAGLTTPGWWNISPARSMPVRVVCPQLDNPVVVTEGSLALVVEHAELDTGRVPGIAPDSEAVAGYVFAIRSGERPVVLALDATRPGQTDDLAFVLDGRHALAAYLSMGMDPTVRLLACAPPRRDVAWCWHPDRVFITHPLSELAKSSRAPHTLGGREGGQQSPCDCADWLDRTDGPDCRDDDPLWFSRVDLNTTLREQPRTARSARPVFATVGPPGWLWSGALLPGHLVEVSDGAGVIRVQGSRASEASVLWLRHEPVAASAHVSDGTLWRLIARLAPSQRPAGMAELVDWLADPVIERDHSGNPFLSGNMLDRLAPLLKLFEPGQYAIKIADNGSPVQPSALVGLNRPWTVGECHTLLEADIQWDEGVLPIDTWPPQDAERIAWYRDRIAQGANPIMVLVAPGPPRPGAPGPPRFLLDGHHKLAAGASLFLEISPCRDDGITNTEFAALIEPHLRRSPFLGEVAGHAHTDSANEIPMGAAEYYALYGVRYGHPAAPAPHHETAERVLRALTARTGADRLIHELTEFAASTGLHNLAGLIFYAPGLFESRLLDGLSGVHMSKQEFAMIADSVTDIDDPRLTALRPR